MPTRSPRRDAFDQRHPSTFRTVTLDGTGAATLIIPGPPPWRQWRLMGTSLAGASSLTPQARIYRNSALAQNQIGVSYNANGSTSHGDDPFYPGDSIVVVWSAGTAGAVMAVTLDYLDLPWRPGGTT